MANPTVTASLDKSTYNAGDLATLTVTYGDADNQTQTGTITITGTDEDGNQAVVTIQRSVKQTDNVTVSVSDSAGKTWTKKSDNGSVAVYTATM